MIKSSVNKKTLVSYPDEGELIKTKNKKSDVLIFFAHFFKGHKKALKRHVEFVNDLGFDAYVFNLKDSPKDHAFVPYSHQSKKFGLKHAIADQIEDHLNLLPEYNQKIMYAFSNVTGCAMEAMARRFKLKNLDIISMICDSGPGKKFLYSSYHLMEYQMGFKNPLIKAAGLPIIALGWSPLMHKDIEKDLRHFPEKYPILSIRGWKDPMISPEHIDAIFIEQTHLRWQKLSLPEAGHLNGLRDFPDLYKPSVEKFILESIS